MKSKVARTLPLRLLALPVTAFAVQTKPRKVTMPEAIWVRTTLLPAGDYEVKWDGPGPAVQVSFLQGKKSVATVPATATAAAATGRHGRAALKTDNPRKLQSLGRDHLEGRVADL
jgi:hypothetical protein